MAERRNDEKGPEKDRGRDFSKSPAKVAGDRDEAKALPDDVSFSSDGGPDADAHVPAAAPRNTDEEAGLAGSSGGITPLKRRD